MQARHLLPAPNRNIDVTGINLHPRGSPSGAFSGKDGCARTHKGIEHQITMIGHIPDIVSYQCDGLDGWMVRQISVAVATKAIGTGIVQTFVRYLPNLPS